MMSKALSTRPTQKLPGSKIIQKPVIGSRIRHFKRQRGIKLALKPKMKVQSLHSFTLYRISNTELTSRMITKLTKNLYLHQPQNVALRT